MRSTRSVWVSLTPILYAFHTYTVHLVDPTNPCPSEYFYKLTDRLYLSLRYRHWLPVFLYQVKIQQQNLNRINGRPVICLISQTVSTHVYQILTQFSCVFCNAQKLIVEETICCIFFSCLISHRNLIKHMDMVFVRYSITTPPHTLSSIELTLFEWVQVLGGRGDNGDQWLCR